ncbi:MAG: hypothetical protein CVU89_04280 [Firmicutes bacterium HGW-Firmicutes-14]|nr:MAG: hypothetical protein CVU89_04280 [Firmicutes bacterium HGW-Firmicutes-14]
METVSLPDDLMDLMGHHGHLCFGVLTGYKACKYAVEIIGVSENMKAVTENGSCGDDAIRVILNCTEENGRLTQKKGRQQSWSFYNPDEEEGIQLTLNPHLLSQLPADKDQAIRFILELPGNLLFMVESFSPDM